MLHLNRLLSFLFVSTLIAVIPAEADTEGFALLELFTSQGCSSCPPADALLKAIAAETETSGKPIHTLSFHVDYWNYLGWKDPYSGKGATERQRSYARSFGSGRSYTPQLVVNGTHDIVGSHVHKVRSAIRQVLKEPHVESLAIEPKLDSDSLRVKYVAKAVPATALLRVAIADSPPQNYVKRGENSGSTLSHTSVVRLLETKPLSTSPSGELTVSLPSSLDRNSAKVVAFVQDPKTMQVLAVASSQIFKGQ